MTKPEILYHGSPHQFDGPLRPVLNAGTEDQVHTKPAVFGTARMDLAALFMFPLDTLASIGFEQDIAYICIWGSSEEFEAKDQGGFLYILPSETFEKIGKEYEWQSFTEVEPKEIKFFPSVVSGMIKCCVQVYFINDEDIFDRIRDNKENRTSILKNLISENQKQSSNIKKFN